MNPRTILHALAWSLPDVQPAPRSPTLASVRGESPGAWHLCHTCDGERHDRYRRPCPTCAGAGRYRVDPITLQPVAAHDSHATSPPRTTPCDRCAGTGIIPRRWAEGWAVRTVSAPAVRARTEGGGMVRCPPCDGTGRLDLPRTRRDPAPAALLDDGTALARLRALGSWDELEHALDELRDRDRAAWRAWVTGRVGGTPPNALAEGASPLSLGVSRAFWGAESWLLGIGQAWVCPGVVLVAFGACRERAVVAERQRRARVFRPGAGRTHRIQELALEGLDCAAIAEACGVSASTVSRALRVAA